MNTTFITGLLSIVGLIAAAPVMGVWAQEDSIMMEDKMDDAMMSVTGTVQIGGLFPLSGELASIGLELRGAADLAVADFNAYLTEQNAGWQIELVAEDTGTNPVQALEKLQSLRAKEISLVVGPATSGSLGHVKGYADANKILLVSASSTAPNLAIPDDNVYRLAPSDDHQGVAMATVMNLDGVTGIVPMWRGDSYGDGLRDVAAMTFEGYGGEVHSGVRYAPNTPDFGLEVALLNEYVDEMVMKHGAENVAVYVISFEEGERIIESAQTYDLLEQVRWYGGEALTRANYLAGDTTLSEFATLTAFTAMDVVPGDKASRVSDHLSATIGSFQTAFVYPQYDSVWVLGKSIMRAQSTDAVDIKAVISDVAASYTGGALSSTRLNADGDLDLANYQVWMVTDNTWTKRGIFAPERNILTAAEQPEGEVEVGSLYPLTGRQDSTGYDTRDATQLGADHFNAFLDSINAGWDLVIVSDDSATNPNIALEKATTFHSRNIDIIIGPRISSSVTQVKPYADINNMMLISCCSTAPSLAIPGDSVFRLVPDDSKQGNAVGKLLENEGIEFVVPIWRGDTYGDGLHDATKANFESRGHAFAEGVRYNPDLIEFGVSVSALNDAVADAIDEYGSDKVAVFLIAFDESIQILQSASNIGYDALADVRWFGAETLTKKSNILDDTITRDFVADVRFTGVQVAESSGDVHSMVESYFVEKNGETPITLVYHAYDAAWLVGLSILQSGTTNATIIKTTFPDVASNYMGAIGGATLNEAGDLAAADYAVWSVVDGTWVAIGNYSLLDDSIVITAGY